MERHIEFTEQTLGCCWTPNTTPDGSFRSLRQFNELGDVNFLL
jgi:hypothetical protein